MKLSPVCSITHNQIQFGSCPWCKLNLAEDQEASRSWFYDVIEADLLSKSIEKRRVTSANISLFDIDFKVAAEFYQKMFDGPYFSTAIVLDVMALGRKLPAYYLDGFAQNPLGFQQKPILAAMVLSYTFDRWPFTETEKKARLAAISELIKNYPASFLHEFPEAKIDPDIEHEFYLEVQRLWFLKLKSAQGDQAVIKNARLFMQEKSNGED